MLKLAFDVESLTLGEIADLEDVTGRSIGDIDWRRPSGKVVLGMAWILQRRENQCFTLDDARRLKWTEIEVEAKVDPPQTGGDVS